MSHATDSPGLRERKHQRTRAAIQRAAAELAIEGGLQSATISRIAARADVSPRTVSTYFPGKDEIFFSHLPELVARMESRLANGTGGTVDRLEQWINGEAERAAEHQAAGDPAREREIRALQQRAIASDSDLRAKEVQLLASMTDLIADAFATETGQDPQAFGPRLFAAATFGVFAELRTRTKPGEESIGLSEVHQALAFLRAGAPALATAPKR